MALEPADWIGTWACAPQLTEESNLPPAPGLAGSTLRQVVYCSIGGGRLRARFSNEYGMTPLTMNAVQLAVSAGGGAILPNSGRGLTFAGRSAVTLAAGEVRLSDAFDFTLVPLTALAISIHFGGVPDGVTGHPGSRTISYLASGDRVAEPSLPDALAIEHWYVLTGIDVLSDHSSGALVALGDSLTDGRGSTTGKNDRWPDCLSRRLREDPSTAGVAMLNAGIGGNAVLEGGLGPTALQRFERDVLQQSGVRWVIVLEGINDLGTSHDPSLVANLIRAYERFVAAAHQRNVLVYGVPILPFGGSGYFSNDRERARQALNAWIRAPGNFDCVIDLDAAVRDPTQPQRLLTEYDCGDHLHLSPAGYQRLADSIDLALFSS